jgi:hypothetical protein
MEVNGHDGAQVRENSAWPYARTSMRTTGEIGAQPPSEDQPRLHKAKPSTFSHKVKWPQETLYAIALWYAGSGEHWKEIAAANPSMAPDQIQIGNTIAIPLSLIKTHEPMPSGFLENRIKSRQTPAVTRHMTPVETPPLYGSIDYPSRY